MKYLFIPLLLIVRTLFALDITLSKDTYLVRPPSGNETTYTSDTVAITNSGSEIVQLDSALFEFENLDTTRYLGEPPFFRMNEFYNGRRRAVFWELESLGNDIYRYIHDQSRDWLSIGASGNRTLLTNIGIGSCMKCANIYALSFSHAVIQLYYNNGQKIELNLKYADGITVSKDSLWVYNNIVYSKSDGVIFYNYSKSSTVLDSAVIRTEVMDTTENILMTDLEVLWMENSGTLSNAFLFEANIRDDSSFLLKQITHGAMNPPVPFSGFHPGDSTVLGRFQIGSNLLSALMPSYPKYIEGVLYLYFDNGEMVELQLYSDDLREPLRMKYEHVLNRAIARKPLSIYLFNGRKMSEMMYPTLKPRIGNMIIIHDDKIIQPAISGIRSYRGK